MIKPEEITPAIVIRIDHYCPYGLVEHYIGRITIGDSDKEGIATMVYVEVKNDDRFGALLEVLEKGRIRALQGCVGNPLKV